MDDFTIARIIQSLRYCSDRRRGVRNACAVALDAARPYAEGLRTFHAVQSRFAPRSRVWGCLPGPQVSGCSCRVQLRTRFADPAVWIE